jgi:dolichyl-phosphate-mannose-protein mannosyltransferase
VKISGEDKPIPVWVILLCLLTLVFGVGGHEPWTPDEPREAGIALTMSRGGITLIPELGGKPFVEKPPLYYWASALMIRTLGAITDPATGARGLSALAAALTLLLVWAIVRSCRAGFQAVAALLILSTAFGFVRAGHWIIIDTLLMGLISAAVLLFFVGVERDKRGLLLAGYLAAGLAFLTKGFVAWALIGLPWLMILALNYRKFSRRLLLHLAGLVLLMGLPLLWMIIFYKEGGEALWREWFIDNQIGRFTGAAAHLGHIKGPFYYFWLVPLLLLPWTPVLIDWIVSGRWKSSPGEGKSARNLLIVAAAWGLGGLLLLSLSGTKREVYFYPLLPAFAIITAAGIGSLSRWCRITLLVISLIFFIPLPIFTFLDLDWNGSKLIMDLGFNLPLAICSGLGIFSILSLKKRPLSRTAALAALFYIAAALTAFPILNKVWSYKPMTLALTAAIPEDLRNRVCIWGDDETTQGVFSYYSNLTLPMVNDPDRIPGIIKGEDPEFDLIVIPRLNEFENKNPAVPKWKVLAQAKKGRRRVFYLITGEWGLGNRE